MHVRGATGASAEGGGRAEAKTRLRKRRAARPLAGTPALIVVLTLALWSPGAARAAGWQRETGGSLGLSWELGKVKVDPLGDYFIGMGPDGYQYLEVRGPGPHGAYSALQAVPGAEGAFGVDYAFESDGGSWWIVAGGDTVQVMHRAPGQHGAFGPATTLDSVAGGALDHAAVGVSPEGDVLAVWESGESSTNADLEAAVKPAGSSSFSAPQVLAGGVAISGPVGATLDAGGSAVVVWGEGTGCAPYCTGVDLKQMTRPAGPLGEPGLEGATTLASYSGTESESYFHAYYADALGGNAVLVYEDEPVGSEQIFMYARTRAPAAAFGGPVTLSAGSESGRHVVPPVPQISIAADGSAALAWTELVPCGGSGGFAAYAMASFAPGGSGFGTPAQLASGDAYEAGLRPSAPAIGIAGEGEWVGGWGGEEAEEPLCGPHSSPSYSVALTSVGMGSPILTPVGSHEDLESVRAVADPVSGGYEGLVVWTSGAPASTHELEAAHFEEMGTTPPGGEEQLPGEGSESGSGQGNGSSSGPSGPGQAPGGGGGRAAVIAPRELVSASPFRRGRPEAVASCPADAAQACTVHVGAYTSSGALPGSSTDAAHHGGHGHTHASTLLGRASATVAPGKRKRLKLHLTKAGRRLVRTARRRSRTIPMRLVVRISAGDRSGSAVLKEKLRAPKAHGRAGKRHGQRLHAVQFGRPWLPG